MQSLLYVKGSNGAGNASQMTVQTLRSPGASDILVNTVTGVPTQFYGSMGAPHTFTDPVTNETITIISEATAVDFAGHIDTGKIVIDAIAPGYVDTRGSLVGDIVVVRPVTEWANNLFNVLNQSHNADGTIKDSAITYAPIASDFTLSGGAWTAITLLTAGMTALIGYQAGQRGTIAAVASRAFTASKDTYVDVLRNTTTNAFSLVYTEVANGAASPALAANSYRLAKVITSGTAVTSIIQYGKDSLGNPIYNGLAVDDLRSGTGMSQDSNNFGPGAGFTTIPNTGLTLTTTRGSKVMAYFSATKVFLTGGTVLFNVFVDGNNTIEVCRTSNSNGAVSGMVPLPPMTPGVHTIDIRGINSGGSYQLLQFNNHSAAYWEVAA